jgi:hypothetical protein
MESKEHKRQRMAVYRAKNRLILKEKYKEYYLRKRQEEMRKKAMGEKKCLCCGIFLASPLPFGGFKTSKYCNNCTKEGSTRKHQWRKQYARLKKVGYFNKIRV